MVDYRVFAGGQCEFTNMAINGIIEVVDGGQTTISDSFMNGLVITEGTVFVVNSEIGDVSMASASGNTLVASNVFVDDVTLVGGSSNQEVVIEGMKTAQGRFQATGDFRQFHLSGFVSGSDTAGASLPHTFTDLSKFYVQATSLRSQQEGFKFDGCVAGDAYLTVINPGAQTDNTYDGIDLVDCDQLNLFGAVRGAVSPVTNNPRYGIDIPSGNTVIDVWMALSGYQTGAINDGTGGQVTVH